MRWSLTACLLASALPVLAADPHQHDLRGDAPPPRHGARLELVTARGETLVAYASGDPAAPRALLLLHEMWGLTPWVEAEADAWAARGYRVLAPDLYAGRLARDSREAYALMRGVDGRRAARLLGAALDALAGPAQRPVGVLGWCFGGEQALAAALAHPARVQAVVMYYGRPVTSPRRLAALDAPVLGLFASRDSWVPRGQVERFARAMASAGKSLDLVWFDAGHAFANPSGAHHDARLAAEAEARAVAFLDAALTPRASGGSGTL